MSHRPPEKADFRSFVFCNDYNHNHNLKMHKMMIMIAGTMVENRLLNQLRHDSVDVDPYVWVWRVHTLFSVI